MDEIFADEFAAPEPLFLDDVDAQAAEDRYAAGVDA